MDDRQIVIKMLRELQEKSPGDCQDISQKIGESGKI
jgi:hypothetical protein